MPALLVVVTFLSVVPTYGQSTSDMYASVKQSAVDKVVHDAQYPITLIDQWWPFTGDISASGDRMISPAEGMSYLAISAETSSRA